MESCYAVTLVISAFEFSILLGSFHQADKDNQK